MTTLSQSAIGPGAHVTLHYRMSAGDSEIVSTFAGTPATLQMGSGQLAPFLEQCLIGMLEGEQRSFSLRPEDAFGQRNQELLQRVTRDMLQQHSATGEQFAVGDVVEFEAPGGGRFAGVIRECSEDDAVFDFNHPLAGQAIDFEVRIIGVL
ncbi:peptidylprolyl isomerase [Lacisediminimonas sp.]|uniref:FKBP-type peptidyl-prolyl cis-trans isomerase n=1 Tax=Lacisediminimonas sp. TaxID=3060582 RepID=UPI002722CA48|nr:peptidylprolyl isomerase [Lacisediminimonas sp.]MDO8300839.1 peptidylprolyl isomerase [Lacisediminimonas sp.]